jgi:hypothetical protein
MRGLGRSKGCGVDRSTQPVGSPVRMRFLPLPALILLLLEAEASRRKRPRLRGTTYPLGMYSTTIPSMTTADGITATRASEVHMGTIRSRRESPRKSSLMPATMPTRSFLLEIRRSTIPRLGAPGSRCPSNS